MNTLVLKVACLGAGESGLDSFELHANYTMSVAMDETRSPCKHATDFGVVERAHSMGNWKQKEWKWPLALVAYNESGCCSTAICADCAMEAIILNGLRQPTGFFPKTTNWTTNNECSR